MKKVINRVIQFRWLIALVLFIVCVSLHLHGSSMQFYNLYLPTLNDPVEAEKYNVFGTDRIIRTDEYVVHTSQYFSQYYNGYDLYSDRMSVGDTNMILDYYAPSKALVTIGKPFNWGYLLFGNEIGLSWYWSGCQIMLFMTAFELFWILTKKDKLLSILGMFMVGLSPALQWFFIPHITIVFIYGMALFDIGYYFFTERKQWKLWLLTVSGVIAFIGFAVSLFPSMQVSVGLAAVLLLIGCLLRDKKDITFNKWKLIQLIIMLMVSGGIVGSFLLSSMDDLKALMNTSYPGRRVSTGGEYPVSSLFTGLTTMFLPYKDSNVLNNSEMATFIHFGPLAFFLYFRMRKLIKEKSRTDLYIGDMLAFIMFVQAFFMLIGFPEWLAKITLFSYINRMFTTHGWVAAIFTVWMAGMLKKYPEGMKKWEILIYAAVYTAVNISFIDSSTYEYLGLKISIAEMILIFVSIILLYGSHKLIRNTGILLMCAVMIFAGATVNPVRRGISPITNHPISTIIRQEREKNPDDAWIVSGQTSATLADFVLANGARVLNATNFYPDFDKWKILDPDGKYYDMYNRYTNQDVNLTDKETYMELPFADNIRIYMNPQSLKDLNVKYLMSDEENVGDLLDKYDITAENLGGQDGYYIYRLSY